MWQKRNASSKSPQAHFTMLHACYMNVACSGNFRQGYSSNCFWGQLLPLFCSYIETETGWLNKTSETSSTPSSNLTSSPSSIVELLMVWHKDFLGGSKAYEQLEIVYAFWEQHTAQESHNVKDFVSTRVVLFVMCLVWLYVAVAITCSVSAHVEVLQQVYAAICTMITKTFFQYLIKPLAERTAAEVCALTEG